MRKLFITAAALVALAAPTAAMADPINPADGWVWNENAASQGNLVGKYTSQITHNGPFVQLQMGEHGRSDIVQGVLAQDGQGRLAK
jgi:hypothetical protein